MKEFDANGHKLISGACSGRKRQFVNISFIIERLIAVDGVKKPEDVNYDYKSGELVSHNYLTGDCSE